MDKILPPAIEEITDPGATDGCICTSTNDAIHIAKQINISKTDAGSEGFMIFRMDIFMLNNVQSANIRNLSKGFVILILQTSPDNDKISLKQPVYSYMSKMSDRRV